MSLALLSCGFVMPGVSMAEQTQKTADSQKNNKADIALTAEIRKAIVADKTLSTSAHNIKIITTNGIVTLRGKVQSEAEKTTLVSKAKDLAGATNVVDDLTVSPPK